jgi:putative ABC transport system permease protein
MAARELLRRPRTFLVPVGILGLLALLLLYPSSILDGIVQETTAGVRNAPADLIVYTYEANAVPIRSRIEPALRDAVDDVPGTRHVSTFDVVLFSGTSNVVLEPLNLALIASDAAFGDHVPAPGEAIVEDSLHDRLGLRKGDQLVVGPWAVPIKVAGFASGTNLFFNNGVVVNKSTWLTFFGADARAAETAAPAAPSQALLVTVDDGRDPVDVAGAIDRATGGTTQTMTLEVAVASMPGIKEQDAIFGYMRLITLAVALVVVALFLSFTTLERAPLYAALKAIGASSRQLYLALVVQVLLITAAAVSSAVLTTFLLTRLPTHLPTALGAHRVFEATVALALTALVGSGLSLRRVVRVDPADAIG